MMTKYMKTIAIISTLILVGLFISATFYIQNQTANLSDSYNVRKEELLANQQKLEILVIDLNKTLEVALAREKTLSTQLAKLESQNSTVPVSPTPTPAPTPTPTPQPPKTRAS
jgi:hypothetical protein